MLRLEFDHIGFQKANASPQTRRLRCGSVPIPALLEKAMRSASTNWIERRSFRAGSAMTLKWLPFSRPVYAYNKTIADSEGVPPSRAPRCPLHADQSAQRSNAKHGLDRAPFVHRAVAFGDVGERQYLIEDPSGIDLALQYQINQVRQETADRGGATEHTDLREEQRLSIQLDAVRHADVADHGAGTRALDGLRHRLIGANALQHGIRTDVPGELLDPGHTLIATLGDNVGRAELEGEVLPCLMAAHRDDPPGAHLLCRENTHQSDGAITHDRNCRAGLHTPGIRRVPAGSEHVACRKQARDQVVIGQLGRCDQRSVGERHARQRRLRAGHEFALLTGRLETEPAMRAGVVGNAEGANDELAWPNRGHRAADLLDDAAIFVAHGHRGTDFVQAAEGPEVRPADAARREPDDRVRRMEDLGLGYLLATN